jgi:Helix-turn-helix domain
MGYPVGAVERAMKVQEVILRALSGQLTWGHAADILGCSPRSIRRLRLRYQRYGYDGLFDHRRQTPSPKRAPVAEVERLLHLYRAHYDGFNVRHFLRKARREHGIRFCYAFVKKALQGAGLVAKQRARGRHRRRREPRPCFGELLHLDGSRHQWLALVPEQWLTLITVVDDATKQVLYAQLTAGGESTATVMMALRAVFTTRGLPMALYTDRAHWAAHTPVAGGAVDRTKLTQVGRALAQLGIEHILGYSPQARGRSERMNGTLQGRLVNELRLAGLTTVAAANRYLRERFLPDFNAEFHRPPAEPTPAFVPLGPVDLEQILCHQDERVVARDNTVTLDGVVLQLAKQPGRRSCTGLHVLARRHLDGRHSVWLGTRRLGLFDARGRALTAVAA